MLQIHQSLEEHDEKPEHAVMPKTGTCKSSNSSQEDLDAIERASPQGPEPHEDLVDDKAPSRVSLELKRSTTRASNVLERVLTTRSITDPGPPPDGGFKAWAQVGCGWLVIFTTWGWINSFGVWQTYYTLNLDVSPATISWIGSVQNFLTFVIGAFSGRLLDAGFFIPTLTVGTLLQLIGIFMMSLSTKFWQLMLTQGVLTGLGGGIFFPPAIGLIATYFSEKRSFAIGIATTGNAAGGALYPVIVSQLLPVIGFAWTARVLGFLNMAFLSIVFVFMRPRLPPRASGPIVEWKAFKSPIYSSFVLAMFLVIWAIYYTFYYIASFGVQTLGMDYTASTNLVILLNAVGVPARIIPPFFADRLGQLNLVVPTLFILTIVSYCWLVVDSIGGLYAYTVFYGLASASFQCLFPSTIASITPDMRLVGTYLGMGFTTLSFASLTGPVIGGALQSADGGKFTGASIFAATVTLLAAMCACAARVSKGGWKLFVKC